MQHKGKISTWHDDKGFGFIAPHNGDKQVFVHINAFSNKSRRPLVNDVVTYALKYDATGRIQAASVLFASERLTQPSTSGFSKVPVTVVIIFVFFITAMVLTHQMPQILLWLYFTTSLATFIAYAIDKSAARSQRWRTPEKTLHLLALAGGWPGAFAAQRLLRHKSSKQSFRTMFWITVALNCAALCWLLFSSGSAGLRGFIS